MARKDRDRFQRLQGINPNYIGYRGVDSSTSRSQSTETETIVCSSCQRKRNVEITDLPENINQFVCLGCRDSAVHPIPQ